MNFPGQQDEFSSAYFIQKIFIDRKYRGLQSQGSFEGAIRRIPTDTEHPDSSAKREFPRFPGFCAWQTTNILGCFGRGEYHSYATDSLYTLVAMQSSIFSIM